MGGEGQEGKRRGERASSVGGRTSSLYRRETRRRAGQSGRISTRPDAVKSEGAIPDMVAGLPSWTGGQPGSRFQRPACRLKEYSIIYAIILLNLSTTIGSTRIHWPRAIGLLEPPVFPDESPFT